MHHSSPHAITKSIPPSDDIVQRRNDEMAEDIKESLCDMLKNKDLASNWMNPGYQAMKLCSWVMLVLLKIMK